MSANGCAKNLRVGWCLYEDHYKFKPGSRLGEFVQAYYSKEKEEFSLAEVIVACYHTHVMYIVLKVIMILRGSISSGEMADEFNPSVIICSRALERALGMRALHESEILTLVKAQLEDFSENRRQDPFPCTGHDLCTSLPYCAGVAEDTMPPGDIGCAGSCSHALKDGVFAVKPQFLKVIRRAPCLGKDLILRQVHTFKEVCLASHG